MNNFKKLLFLNLVIFIFFFFIGYAQASTANSSSSAFLGSGNQMPVYIVMGQSNAVGVAEISKLPGMVINDFQSSNWSFLYGSAVTPAQAASGVTLGPGSNILTADPIYGTNDFGPDLMIASSLNNNGLKKFCIFKFAVGGSSLNMLTSSTNWWGYKGQGGYYDKAVTAFNTAMGQLTAMGYTPVVKAIFWMQGESDATDLNSTLLYRSNLKSLIKNSQSDFQLGSNPFIMGLIQENSLFQYFAAVRNAQEEVASSLSNVGYFETNDLPRYTAKCVAGASPECLVHYTPQGQYELGVRFFDKYINMTFNNMPPPPQTITASASGNSVTLNWSSIDWSASNLYTTTPAVTAVQLQISEDSGNTWFDVMSSTGVVSPIATSCGLTSCKVNLYSPGKFAFRVRAFSQGGFSSPWSTWSSWSNWTSNTDTSANIAGAPSTVNGNASISSNEITIGTSNAFAGAIDSLTWNGVQFINAADHGRDFQTAFNFDGDRECLNPTEAGGNYDNGTSYSTSKLFSLSASGSVLTTSTQMAYWNAPGGISPGCTTGAINTTRFSPDVMTKQVTIGFQNMPNVVQYKLALDIPETTHTNFLLEAATAYMPPSFSDISTYDPSSGTLNTTHTAGTPSGSVAGQFYNLPVILSTPDGNYAMGVYSPGLPQGAYPAANGYRGLNISGVVMKNDCMFSQQPVPPGIYNYSCYFPVGTLLQVETSLKGLYNYFKGQQSEPSVTLTSPTNGTDVSGTVNVEAQAMNNFGSLVSSVQFQVDGQNLGAAQTTSPYSVSWNTSSLSVGTTHYLAATATDSAGNTATSIPVTVTIVSGSGSSSGKSSATVPVYQFFSGTGGHFYSLSKTEGTNAGFSYEGNPWSVYATSSGSTSALLYRCFIPQIARHIVTRDKTCGGYTKEGQYGYVDTVLVGSDVALYQYVNASDYDQFVSTSETSPGGGYVSKGILGYVPGK